jgi:hypothetical protein
LLTFEVSLLRLLEEEVEVDEVSLKHLQLEGSAGLDNTFLAAWLITGVGAFISSCTTLSVMS